MNLGPGIQSWLRRTVVLVIMLSGGPARADVAELLRTANIESSGCEAILENIQSEALPALRARNKARIARFYAAHKVPGFDQIEVDGQHEYIGEDFPKALQALAGFGKMVAVPAPTAPLDVAVGKDYQTNSTVLHVDHEWAGGPSNTAAYIYLPHTQVPDKDGYLVGQDVKTVILNFHGGGVRTGTGDNGMNIAKETGLPVFSIDFMGHGMATRNFRGIEDIDKQIDWAWDIIEKSVHPGVKFVLEGHSWGAQFALRIWARSNEPRFKRRIKRIIAASGPADSGYGLDDDKRIENERNFEEHLAFYKDRIAGADFDFLNGMVRGGKPADTGNSHANVTDIGFRMPIPTAEQQKDLVPLTIVMGKWDGLVYVGREEAQDALGNALVAPHRYILMDKARSWRSQGTDKEFEVGHTNIWDAYMPGTEIPWLYNLIKEDYAAVNGSLPGPDPMVELARSTDPKVRAEALAKMTLDELYRRYDKYFVFREYVNNHVEWMNMPTADFESLKTQKDALSSYVQKYVAREGRSQRDTDTAVKKAGENLRAQLSISDAITVDKAKAELDLPAPSPERQVALKAYMDKYKEVEGQVREELGLSGASRAGDDPRLAAIPGPDGIKDFGQAKREYEADRSATRREALEKYIEQYPTVVKNVRDRAQAELAEATKGDKVLEGVTSIEDAKTLLAKTTDLLNMSYAPPDHPEVVPLVETIRYLAAKRQQLITGSKAAGVVKAVPSKSEREKELKKLNEERRQSVARFDEMWKLKLISSARVTELTDVTERDVKAYEHAYIMYKNKTFDWQRGLEATGQNTAENMQNMPPELIQMRAEYWKDKASYVKARDQLPGARWDDALAGRLVRGPGGTEASVAEAAALAVKMFGTSRISPSPDSIAGRVSKQENYESLLNTASILDQSINRLRWQYQQIMTKAGYSVPFTIRRVAIAEELNSLTYAELLQKLIDDPLELEAFNKTIVDSNPFLNQLRNEQQSDL